MLLCNFKKTAFVLSAILGMFGVSSAAIIKLNDPLVAPQAVVTFTVSPDANTVVYIVGDNATDKSTLYSVPALRTTAPVALNTPAVGAAVGPYTVIGGEPLITADSQRVLYISDEDNLDEIELYSVPIGGGTRVLLSSQLAANEDVGHFEISSNGTTVVYLSGDPTDTTTYKLWSIPVTGGTATNLSSATGRAARSNFKLTPNGARAVTMGVTGTTVDMFSMPIGGGSFVQLSNFGKVTSNVFEVPNNTNVIFYSEPQVASRNEMMTVPIDGSASPVRLHPLISVANEDAVSTLKFSFDKTKVVATITDGGAPAIYRSYVSNVDGTGQTRLGVVGDSVFTAYGFNKANTKVLTRSKPSAASGFATYIADIATGSLTLSATAIATPGPTTVNAVSGNTGNYQFLAVDINTVHYEPVRYDIDSDTLAAAMATNNTSDIITRPYQISANDNVMVFAGRQTSDTVTNLYMYNFATATLTQVNGTFVAGGNLDLGTLRGYRLAAGGTAVVYAAEQDIDLVAELYVNTSAIPSNVADWQAIAEDDRGY